MDHFTSRAKSLLQDRNHGVLLAGITLVTEMCEMDENVCAEFRKVCFILLADEIRADGVGDWPARQTFKEPRFYRLQPGTRCRRHYRSFLASEDPAPASITG